MTATLQPPGSATDYQITARQGADYYRVFDDVPAADRTRTIAFEPIAMAVAKAITASRSLAYRSIATARPEMWAGSRKSIS